MVLLHPLAAREPRLAVDLSGRSVRVLQGAPGGAMRCADTPVSTRALSAGRVVDAGLLGHALESLLSANGITGTRAMFAASDAIATFRVLTFPAGTPDADVDAAVTAELPLGDARLGIRQIEIANGHDGRTVYAIVWDRSQVEAISTAAKEAGLKAAVVDLKSLCVARAVPMRSYLICDLTAEPCEVVLIDDRIPRVRHTFSVEAKSDVAAALAGELKPVLSFYRGAGTNGFDSEAPILLRSEQPMAPEDIRRLEQLTGHPVDVVPRPQRIDPGIDHSHYLTCIGLGMRRHM